MPVGLQKINAISSYLYDVSIANPTDVLKVKEGYLYARDISCERDKTMGAFLSTIDTTIRDAIKEVHPENEYLCS